MVSGGASCTEVKTSPTSFVYIVKKEENAVTHLTRSFHIPLTSSHFLPLFLSACPSWTHPLSSDSCYSETHTHTHTCTHAHTDTACSRQCVCGVELLLYESTRLTLSAFSQLCRASAVWTWPSVQSSVPLTPKSWRYTCHAARLMEALLCSLSFTGPHNNEEKLHSRASPEGSNR